MSTTTKLLDAAEYRMRRGGYNSVSFRDVASDANIKSSSVHYHYPKKEDLGIALIERYSERFFVALDKATKKASTPQSRLKAFQKTYKAALIEGEAICLCGLLGAEVGCLPSVLTKGIQDFFSANIKWVEEVLPQGIKKIERKKIASQIVADMQGAMMLATSMNDLKLFDTITNQTLSTAIEKS